MVKYSINKHSNFLLDNLIKNADGLGLIIKKGPVNSIIVDAGIGKPSDAAKVMELGIDAVLLNSSVARSFDPQNMSEAMKLAVVAGRKGYLSGMIEKSKKALKSTPFKGKISNF